MWSLAVVLFVSPQEPVLPVPVPAGAVHVDGAYWAGRLQRVREVTIPHSLAECERTRRIANFRVAAGRERGGMAGFCFDDSDVYKVLEGAARCLLLERSPELQARVQAVVDAIVAAQEKDGYLYTARTIMDPANPPRGGAERWSDMAHGHELYCAGHLYEAAVAWAQATGRDDLLKVAEKNAGLVLATFGPGRNPNPCGHPEIELGLLALFQHAGERRWLDQARWFLDARGRHAGRKSFGEYAQDHVPLVEQQRIVGHSVRAAYLYGAAAGVGMLADDEALVACSRRMWQDMVDSKIYLSGGIGSQGSNEGFGAPFELPNDTGYGETCASIANALWSWRLFQATGEGVYCDMVERVLYNAFESGWSQHGDRFFYPNPLASPGAERQAWFRCACCPPNVCRFVPQVPGMLFAARGDVLWIEQFVQASAAVGVAGATVGVRVETGYPWHGRVVVALDMDAPTAFELRLRLPGWAQDRPQPGALYSFAGEPPAERASLQVNGRAHDLLVDRGHWIVRRNWRPGDRIEFTLPMPVRRVHADPRVAADRDRVALQRGPIVYCLEGVDLPGVDLGAVRLPDDAVLRAVPAPDLFGGITVLQGQVVVGDGRRDAQWSPYGFWANRGKAPMQVWLRR